jgi:NitT/TauT family transport system substrate-binding protein
MNNMTEYLETDMSSMFKSKLRLPCLIVLASAFVGFAWPAAAQNAPVTLKVALVKSANILVLQYGVDKGIFAAQGLQLDTTYLNNGPAIVSAVVSGSVQVGFAATVAAISARANNQPVKLFAPLTIEAYPDHFMTWYDAAGRLGPMSVAQLKGRTVAMNAAGASCEMQLKAFLDPAGVPWDSIRVLILPFPQIPAALQLGNADVGCLIQPFHAAAMLSPEIKAQSVITGTYPDLHQLHSELIDGFLGRDDWLKAHADEAVRFSRAMMIASQAVMKDPSILATLMERDLKIAPLVAAAVQPSFDTAKGPIREADIGATVALMRTVGMLTQPLSVADLIFPVDR